MRKQLSLPFPLLLLALASLPALAQQGAPRAQPFSTQSGDAAQRVVPMVWDASVNAFVPQGSGYVAQTFAGTGTLQIATAGIGTVTVQATGSGAGLAFVFQGSSDGGTTWQTLPGFVPSSGVAATSFSANGIWQANPAAFTLFRVNLSGISSGTETFTVTTSTAQAVLNGANIAVTAATNYSGATGAAVPSNAAYIGANKSGNLVAPTLDSSSNLNINCQAGCNGSNGSVSATGAAVPGSATYLGGTNGGSLQGVAVNGSGQVAVQAPPSLPLPSGAATAANQTNVEGTAGSPASSVLSVQGVSGGTPAPVSGTVTANEGGAPWTVSGAAASGSSVSGNPMLDGGRAQNAEPSTVANGQAVAAAFDLAGKILTSPYANRENMLRGANSTTGTGATTLTGMGAQGTSVKIYVTDLECSNTSATTTTISLNDGATSVFIVPAGYGTNVAFNVPLVVAANTAAQFTAAAGVSTIYCNAQGFAGY